MKIFLKKIGLLFFACTVLLTAEYRIVVVAGQSNSLNIHSDASLLPTSDADTLIPFYYDDYYVPSGDNVPMITSSHNKWVTLRAQYRDDLRVPGVYFNEFFGPEMTLARTLQDTLDSIAVFKFSVPGSDLAYEWGPEQTEGPLLMKKMFIAMRNAENYLRNAGENFSWIGFTWMQGESDAANLSYSQNYFRNMKLLMNAVRDSLGEPELPFVIGHIADELPLNPYAYREMVRDAQERVAERDDHTLLVDTRDYPMDTDNTHFLAPGVIRLGEDMAAALLQIMSGTVESAVADLTEYDLNVSVFPNPSNAAVAVRFTMPASGTAKMSLYDLRGQCRLEMENTAEAGSRETVRLNAKDLPSGIYCLKVSAAGLYDVRRVLLMK